jgi:aspartyl-tRNA(Asn)/glutamyl-tRNA(Gln) amidotransferase subunit C
MSVDAATVRKVAKLARIAVEDHEIDPLAAEISGILDWVEQLQEVDVTGGEPMTSAVPMRLKRREDVITDGDRRDDILANAPDSRSGFFAVPKVVE